MAAQQQQRAAQANAVAANISAYNATIRLSIALT